MSPACVSMAPFSIDASVPQAPPNSPMSTRGRNCSRRSRWRWNPARMAAILKPKVNGIACCRVAAADHRRIAIAARQLRQGVRNGLQIGVDQVEPLAYQHHGGGVGDVLRGRAPVAILAELVAAQRVDLRHDAENRVADPLGLGSCSLAMSILPMSQLRTISSAASCGMMPSRPCTIASAFSMSTYFAVRFSSDQT